MSKKYILDSHKNLQPANIYLCNVGGQVLFNINNFIDYNSAGLTENLNNQFELTFNYMQTYTNVNKGVTLNSPYYGMLSERMELFVENVGRFVMSTPKEVKGAYENHKVISAYSIDKTLQNFRLVNLEINTGTKTSLEYLVSYDEDETEQLLSAYTNLPYDYILFYDTRAEQLSNLLADNLADGTYSDSTIITKVTDMCKLIPRLKSHIITNTDGTLSLKENVIYTYDVDNINITSIQLVDFNTRISDLITFYNKYHKQLSLLDIIAEQTGNTWSIGDVYGLSNGDYTLANKKFQFSIDESNIYGFLTQSVASTYGVIIDFNIKQRKFNATPIANMGKNTGINLSFKNLVNEVDISCNDNELVTCYAVSGGNDIGIEYANFGRNKIYDISYYINKRDENGNRFYVSDALATKYNDYVTYCNNQRSVYMGLTKQYNQLLLDISNLKLRTPLDALTTEIDYGTFTDDELLKLDTQYKNLFYTLITLYKNEYGTAGCNYDGSVNETYMANTKYWYDYKNYQYILDQLDAAINGLDTYEPKNHLNWQTEWSLFGSIELQNKYDAYLNTMKMLADSGNVLINTDNTARAWASLTTAEKAKYVEGTYTICYNNYVEVYNNSLGCKSYLDIVLGNITSKEGYMNAIQTERLSLTKSTTLEGYTVNPFTSDEIKKLHMFYTEKTYKNENILSTSLDTELTKVDLAYELYQDAVEQLSIVAQPQFTFDTSLDNLFGLKDFELFWEDFDLGNFLLLNYEDNKYTKLRLTQIKYNPFIPSSQLTVQFSNMIKSQSKRDDLVSLLNKLYGGSSSSSGSASGSSSSSGNYGTDGDITLDNTMLSKLLNSEAFGTRVTNVILDTMEVNSLVAKKMATGIINSIATYVDESGNTLPYSTINLNTGAWNIAGGKFTFDPVSGELTVKGKIIADSGEIGGWEIGDTRLRKSDVNSGLYVALCSPSEVGGKGNGNADVLVCRTGKGTTASPYEYPLVLSSDGSLSCSKVKFTGGQITGSSSWSRTYTSADRDRVSELAWSNNVHPTEADILKYDTDGDGDIDVFDVGRINASIGLYNGVLSYDNLFEINLESDTPIILSRKRTGTTEYIGKTKLGAQAIVTGSVVANDITFGGYDDAIRSRVSTGGAVFYCFDTNSVSYTDVGYDGINIWDGVNQKSTEIGTNLKIPGYVAIGSPINHSYKLYINGNAYCTSGSWSGSDEEIKEEISPLNIEQSSDFIYSLIPSQYKYIDGTSDRFHHGFIAQEVKNSMGDNDWGVYGDPLYGKTEEEIQDLKAKGETGLNKALRYEEIIADLVATVQSQNKRISMLEYAISQKNSGE